jgi:hypothetical protein
VQVYVQNRKSVSLLIRSVEACSVHRISRWRGKCSSMCIDFCFRLMKTGAETYEMLHAAFGESCLSRSKTFEWYSCFRGQTVNKEFYNTVLQCLRNATHRHHPEKWCSGNWILHHDNAPAHKAVTTNKFLAKHNILSLPHPP